jgi:hypothetical protein
VLTCADAVILADRAADLMQDFFAGVLEGRYLDRADPEKSR